MTEAQRPRHLRDLAVDGRTVADLLDLAQTRRLRVSVLASVVLRAIRSVHWPIWYLASPTRFATVPGRPPAGSLLRLHAWTGDLRELLRSSGAPVNGEEFDAPLDRAELRDLAASQGLHAEFEGLRCTAAPSAVPLTLEDLWVAPEDAEQLLAKSTTPRPKRRGNLTTPEKRHVDRALDLLKNNADAWITAENRGGTLGRPNLYQLKKQTGVDQRAFSPGRRIGDALEPLLDAAWHTCFGTERPK